MQDRAIRTAGEELAARLVDQAGIVIPSCAIDKDSAVSGPVLRKALAAQLALQEQVRNNLAAPQQAVFDRIVAKITDSEIVFAFKRALRTFRLLTNSPDNTNVANGACGPLAIPGSTNGSVTFGAGLKPPAASANGISPLAASVAQLQGVVIDGGIPRSRLTTDPMARAGGMIEASQCDTITSLWDAYGDARGTTPSVVSPWSLPPDVFQDSFHMGQAIERRLVALREAADDPAITGAPNNDAEAIARGGIAEVRSWAGSTIVHSSICDSDKNLASPQCFEVRVDGMSAADLGLSAGVTGDARTKLLTNTFAFVWGQAWVAECAAGVRADCPTNFEDAYIQLPTATIEEASVVGAAPATLDTSIRFQVHPTKFHFSLTQPTTSNQHIYMVRLHEPRDPLGHGRVMGTISVPTVASSTSFVDAPMQRELLHDAIDLGKWVGERPPRLGDPSAAQSSGYCVDGIPRNLFVPLDNNLTSSNTSFEDSWQHYLDLADQAAQRADALGQDLLNQDLKISENQAAAAQQLATLCGDFGLLSQTTVGNNGKITAGGEDPTTSSCLDEPTTDMVFLADFPAGFPIPTQSDYAAAATAAIKKILGCDSAQGAARSQLCDKPVLTADALKITAATDPTPRSGDPSSPFVGACERLGDLQSSVTTGFKGTEFLQVLSDPTFGTTSMQVLAGALTMTVDLWDNWGVNMGGVPIMSSTDLQYWPACLNRGDGCLALNTVTATGRPPSREFVLADTLNKAFRWCPSGNVREVLGCDGVQPTSLPPAQQPSAPQAELNVLKWRVMHALWAIAVADGEAPAGMFTLPIPAAASIQVPWPASYPGTFIPSGSPVCLGGQNCLSGFRLRAEPSGLPSSLDAVVLGTAYDVASPFFAFPQSSDTELPPWYKQVYKRDPSIVEYHAVVANASTPLGYCKIDHYNAHCPQGQGVQNCVNVPVIACLDPVAATPKPLAEILAAANTTDGVVCARPWGEGAAPPVQDAQGNPWFQADAKAALETLIEGHQQLRDRVDQTAFDYGGGLVNGVEYVLPWEAVPPSVMGPVERAPDFIGANDGITGTCGAISTLLRASTLACLTAPGATRSADPVGIPSISSPDDIVLLEAWLASSSKLVKTSVGNLYATSIPTRVVSDFKTHQVGTGNTGGTKGAAILELEQSMQTIPSEWVKIGADLGQIQSAISTARLAIVAANLQHESSEENLAMQQIQVQGQMAQAVVGFLEAVVKAAADSATSVGFSNAMIPVAGLGLAASLATGNAELSELDKSQITSNKIDANQIAQALAQLGQTTAPLWADLQTSVDNIRGAVAKILEEAQQVQLAEGQASYQVAIGTGADFFTVAGEEVPIPVNTVLRRQASATEKRYQAAVTNAKALAYMARRGIEQRIGVPLNAITTQVGPLDAPASWADDICSLQGINYRQLSSATAGPTSDAGAAGGGIGGALDQKAIADFADSWVGDYVVKLRDFVTYYNAKYPSHPGKDTAVLSLRSDILDPLPQCSAVASNLLLNSGGLDTLVDPALSSSGWQLHPCPPSSTKCLSVLSGIDLAAPLDGPDGPHNETFSGTLLGGLANGVSWLNDVSHVPVSSGPGSPVGGDGGAAAWPGNLVSQQVALDAGTYVLSWWDQARDALGNLPTASQAPVAYVVRVYDPSWKVVASFSDEPFAASGSSSALWSDRRTLLVPVENAGTYRVAFGASTDGVNLGSVAIADVQLETAAATDQPSVYVATGNSHRVVSYNCARSDADLRSSFVHNCDESGICSYDLVVPMLINTESLNAGTSPMNGKLAQGNFNFRHGTLAVNLVGTGLRDCTNVASQSCYGTGYIEYTLEHDATNAGILDYSGNVRVFDFGVSSVQHGKALAAERYLTMPLGSNDASLVSQPGIQHEELSGRPLDGSYRLRIWDTPALKWNRLEDVQIILSYDYWSPIVANGN